jgi:hypothetical protein
MENNRVDKKEEGPVTVLCQRNGDITEGVIDAEKSVEKRRQLFLYLW